MPDLSFALLLLIVTNSAAWLAGHFMPRRWRWPLDAGGSLGDHRRILGDHKTWGGVLAGATACGAATLLMRQSFLLGVGFGILSLAGDCASSFLKRRLQLPAGTEIPGLDQLPEALVPMLALAGPLGLSWLQIAVAAVLFMALDLALVGLRHARRPS